MFQIDHKRKSYLDKVLDKIVSFGTVFIFFSPLKQKKPLLEQTEVQIPHRAFQETQILMVKSGPEVQI